MPLADFVSAALSIIGWQVYDRGLNFIIPWCGRFRLGAGLACSRTGCTQCLWRILCRLRCLLLAGRFMTAGSISLFLGAAVLGWGLVWLVVALAALNAFGGFCVGCAVYYWLARFNLPGFGKQPPAGTFPGMKPKAGASV